MGYIPEDQIERVKDALDIVDIVSGYVELKQTGANQKGLCPFHHEKTPSFIVSAQRNNYHCFGCGEHGDAISFIMKIENLSYIEAIRFLAEKEGIMLEEKAYNKEVVEKRQRLYKINALALRFFFKNMLTEKIPQDYIHDRGLDIKLVNTFFLGYATAGNSLYRFLFEQGVDIEDMLHLGLVSRNQEDGTYYDRFRNRLIFPIINNKKKVIGFGGRDLIDGKIKYLNSPESDIFHKGSNLYNVNLVQNRVNRDRVLLVEGYMDVIGLHSHGIDYALASLGTALTLDQAKLAKRYGRHVYIAYDSDEAGIKATRRAIQIFEEIDVEPKVLSFPKQMDPDDYIKAYGKTAFEKLLKQAKPAPIFEIDYIISQGQDMIATSQALIEFLATIKGNAKREIYVKKVADSLDISFESLNNDVLKLVNIHKHHNQSSQKRQTNPNYGYNSQYKGKEEHVSLSKDQLRIKLEKEILSKALINRTYYDNLKETANEFIQTDSLNLLFKEISQEYETTTSLVLSEVFKSDAYLSANIADQFDKHRQVQEANDNKEDSVSDELKMRISRFVLEEQVEQIYELLKEEKTRDEKIDLTRRLVELQRKLTQ